MHLVQLLLPLYDNDGRPFPASEYASVRAGLTDRFGGLTAYTRAPAEGVWSEGGGRATRDDIVVYEVMVDQLDRGWWSRFRADLERRFAQDELVARAVLVERL
jgi:crotonobetainyl-CoA:carnitine CoA-transferase CaiB-like acyl-CoA transferase